MESVVRDESGEGFGGDEQQEQGSVQDSQNGDPAEEKTYHFGIKPFYLLKSIRKIKCALCLKCLQDWKSLIKMKLFTKTSIAYSSHKNTLSEGIPFDYNYH